MPEQKSKPVSVRLPAEVVEELDDRSKEAGVERSDFLRELIVRGLRTGESTQIQDERLHEIEGTLREVRRDLATMMKAILVMLAGIRHEAADEWVRDNFRSAGEGGEPWAS